MRIKMSRERGRPRGKYYRLDEYTAVNDIILISKKFEIDSQDLYSSLKEAWELQRSTIQNLSIECRIKTQKKSVFLITKDHKTIAQFPIPTHILKDENLIKKYTPTQTLNKKIRTIKKIENPQIKDLKFGMNQINLIAKIVEMPKPKSVFTRYGKLAIVSNAIITDETGKIQLPLWNQQTETLAVGDTIQIKNARVETFQGQPQLKIDRGGKLSLIEKDRHSKN